MKDYASTSNDYAATHHHLRLPAHHNEARSANFRSHRNKVAFVETVVIHKVPSLQSYTDVEMTKCWLTPQDHCRMQKDIKRSAKYMRRGYDESTHDGLCTRGLEHLRDINIFRELTHERDTLVQAVLTEQSTHEPHNSRNIATTSSRLSKRARDRAVQKAHLDAEFVKKNVIYL